MKIHEQNDVMCEALWATYADTNDLILAILRKIHTTYPDGTWSDMVNANSDVLPPLRRMQTQLADALHEVRPSHKLNK